MPQLSSPRRRSKPVTIHIRYSDQEPVELRIPSSLDPHTMVLAAWDRFLPPGVLPYRMERCGVPVAYYNPLAPLAAGGVQDGDVLVCEHDSGQSLDAPSMLQAYRAMRQYDGSSRSRCSEFGHLNTV